MLGIRMTCCMFSWQEGHRSISSVHLLEFARAGNGCGLPVPGAASLPLSCTLRGGCRVVVPSEDYPLFGIAGWED